MSDRIEIEVTCQPPSLDHYRREWTPAANLGLAGIWLGAVVSDASGQYYWGLRGTDDFIPGMTHVVSPICGFRALEPRLDRDAPHLFEEYSSIDWYEPLQYVEEEGLFQTSFSSGRIEHDTNGFHWFDAGGRWELHGKPISEITLTHVPKQSGIDDEVYYRHDLMYVTGKVNGVDVTGYAHQDYAYGPRGMIYTELAIPRQLQGMWVSWLHEYTDGEIGGGSFWQGRDGVPFGPGYQVKDGRTLTYTDIVATPTFSDTGKMIALDVSMGSDTYNFTYDSSGSFLHTFGSLTGNPAGKDVAA